MWPHQEAGHLEHIHAPHSHYCAWTQNEFREELPYTKTGYTVHQNENASHLITSGCYLQYQCLLKMLGHHGGCTNDLARSLGIAEVGYQTVTEPQTPQTKMCPCLSKRSSRIREVITIESSFTGWRAGWCYRDIGGIWPGSWQVLRDCHMLFHLDNIVTLYRLSGLHKVEMVCTFRGVACVPRQGSPDWGKV